jgi:hypothetical protein
MLSVNALIVAAVVSCRGATGGCFAIMAAYDFQFFHLLQLLLGLRFFGFLFSWLTCSLTAFAIPIAFNVPVSLLLSLIALVNSDLNFFPYFFCSS